MNYSKKNDYNGLKVKYIVRKVDTGGKLIKTRIKQLTK